MAASLATLPIGRMSLAAKPLGQPDGFAGVPELGTCQLRQCVSDPVYRRIVGTEPDVAMAACFVLKMGDPWFSANLVQAENIILSFSAAYPMRRLDWPLELTSFKVTECDLSPILAKFNEETSQFIDAHDLRAGVAWLQAVSPGFFSGATFEIDALPREDGEEGFLALRVFSSFSAEQFRGRRHQLCESMLRAGHRGLYEVLSVFQRRVEPNGWQAFSWYRLLSSE